MQQNYIVDIYEGVKNIYQGQYANIALEYVTFSKILNRIMINNVSGTGCFN